jgi:hypothetical protein
LPEFSGVIGRKHPIDSHGLYWRELMLERAGDACASDDGARSSGPLAHGDSPVSERLGIREIARRTPDRPILRLELE